MARTVKFQDPGEGIHEAEVIELAVSAGDEIEEGQVILVVETDKTDFDVQSPHAGVVEKVRVAVGDTVRVGDVLVDLESGADARGARERAGDGGGGRGRASAREASREGDESPGRSESRRGEEPREREASRERGKARERQGEERGAREEGARAEREEEARAEREEEARAEREEEGARDERRGDGGAKRADERERPVPASPATRRLARELGVDLRRVRPSGEQGRVLAQDVRAHAAGAGRRGAARDRGLGRAETALPDPSRWGPVDRAPLRSVRRTIARRMTQAWSAIPHVTTHDDADVTALEAFRQRQAERLDREEEGSGATLSLTVLVLKATAAVLAEFPRFNASLDPEREEIVYRRYLHLGVATDTERGLLVPSIADVDRKSVRVLARELAELSERARLGAVERDEMLRGTFTVTNVGPIGGSHFTPIINWPQVAILGLGRLRREPRFRDVRSTEVEARMVLPLSLAFDHRVNDGADAARFVSRLVGILADPERFALDV